MERPSREVIQELLTYKEGTAGTDDREDVFCYDESGFMSASTRKLFGTAFLVFFVALVVGINFLHKERGPSEETTCPACQFQQNSLGTALVVIVLFLPFVLLSLVELPECRFAEPLFRPKNVSRAPPSA